MPTDTTSRSEFYVPDFIKNNYQTAIFIVYLILIALVVSRHEPWMDEAQPWLYAQDLSLFELLTKYLRYDGHPPLWYLIVYPFARLDLPYFTVNVLSAFFSALGVWLFLRFSPFPAAIKLLFPFTFFVFFQYGVVSRSYCLIAPLLFSIALIYPQKIKRSLMFAVLLSLLASVSAYTFLMSGAIFLVHLFDVARQWKTLDSKTKTRQIIAAFVLGSTAVSIVLILTQPADSSFALGYNTGFYNFLSVSVNRIAGALMMDELSRYNVFQTIASLFILSVSLIWFRYKKTTLLFALPLLLILTLFAVKYSNVWHEGILFLLWIFVLWIGYARKENDEPLFLRRALTYAVITVLLVQVYWTSQAAFYDYNRNYSGAYDLAQHIKRNNLDTKKLFLSGWKALAIMPYFDENIFYNYNNGSKTRFWFWSIHNRNTMGAGADVIARIEADQPDFVVFASDHLNVNSKIEIRGYVLAETFDGNLCWKSGIYEPDSFLLFRKNR